MHLYSQNIFRFIAEVKQIAKEILSREIGLRVSGNRFYDKTGRVSYPLSIVMFNYTNKLGYFDPSFYEMGFHTCLMQSTREQLRNVVRHELAHYLVFILHGEGTASHGAEFRAFCTKMGWKEEVYRATICLEEAAPAAEESMILRKVQKLMALAGSSNAHEAESALIKSQQLLLKHHLEAPHPEEEATFCVKRIMKQHRETSKMRAIARILETFFVHVIYQKTKGAIYLEILGSPLNVEIAEHVAAVLDLQLDQLWDEASRRHRLRGTIAKNSFFLGLARGYCDKIQALKREYNTSVSRALIVLENQLLEAKENVYPRLSSSKRQGGFCAASSAIGQQMGKQLNINPALRSSSKGGGALIGHAYFNDSL